MKEFSLLGFVAHVGEMTASIAEAEHEAMKAAAEIVEREAKAEIGHYQAAAGPFSAWPELADRTKDERVKDGYSENEPGLREGDMRDSINHTVGVREAAIGSNDDHLVWFEVGTGTQPPRSVLGIAAVHKAHEVVEIIGGEVVKALVGADVFSGRLLIP